MGKRKNPVKDKSSTTNESGSHSINRKKRKKMPEEQPKVENDNEEEPGSKVHEENSEVKSEDVKINEAPPTTIKPKKRKKKHKKTPNHEADYEKRLFSKICDEESKQAAENVIKTVENQKQEPSLPGAPPAFFYITWLTKYPFRVFGVTLSLHLLIILISILLYIGDFPIWEVSFFGVPLDIRQSIIRKRRVAYEAPPDGDDNITFFKAQGPLTYLQYFLDSYKGLYDRYFAELVIEDKITKNVLTKSNLEKLKRLELHICKKCKPYSILRFFDGSFGFKDSNFSNISYIINTAASYSHTAHLLHGLVATSSNINVQNVTSHITFMCFFEAFSPTGKYLDRFKPIFDDLNDNGFEGLEIYLKSLFYYYDLAQKIVYGDINLAIGSCVFIFLFIWFHTTSIWLTSWAIFSTLSSFVIANFVYVLVFGFRYFGLFQILTIFIVTGIAADDVFIICDAWHASGLESHQDLTSRLQSCFPKATKAMLVTSLTTAAAFFSSAISPILGVVAFGVYSGLVVTINYLSLIIFYPSVLIIYELKFVHIQCTWCLRCFQNSLQKVNPITSFLGNKYYKFIQKPHVKIFILFSTVTLFAASVYFTSTITTDTKPLRFLRSSFKVERFEDLRTNEFLGPEPNSQSYVVIVWGLQPGARGECAPKTYNHTCGSKFTKIFDPNFGISLKGNQEQLLEFCDYLKNLDEDTKDKLRIKRHAITEQRQIYCPLNAANDALRFNQKYSMPMNITDRDLLVEIFKNWSAIEVDDHYSDLIMLNKNGTEITVAIRVELTLNLELDHFKIFLEVWEEWEKTVNSQINKMNKPLQGGFQTSDKTWFYAEQKQMFTKQGLQTLIASIILGWVVLLVFCGNWIVSGMATLVIMLSSASVFGMVGAIGWKYGIIECVNTLLVVGLSIDYIVHFGFAYSHSDYNDRGRRVQASLEEIGLPVLCGAASTLGSSFFMLFGNIRFFYQFGIFMFATLGFSILYTMTTFLVILLLVGPENDFGSTNQAIEKFKSCIGWRKKSTEKAACQSETSDNK